MTVSHAIALTESSRIGEARRAITAAARALGFGEQDLGMVALVVTEAATNLVKHAVGGQLLWRALECGAGPGIELLALDRGPGMVNAGACMRDGYSTSGSPGTGLGAIIRLAAEFDIHSLPGKGTALLARLWPKAVAAPALRIGVVCLAKPGEQVCGDAWGYMPQAGRHVFMLADGLGHGGEAAIAAQAAVQVLHRRQPAPAPGALIEAAHGALRATRGAALAVAELNLGRQVVTFAGVGNIAGLVLEAERSRHLVSHNGIVGHVLRKVQEFSLPWPSRGLLIMHSDGLSTHWSLDAYPGLAGRDPSLIAGVLYRDCGRGRDDLTVLVVKERG